MTTLEKPRVELEDCGLATADTEERVNAYLDKLLGRAKKWGYDKYDLTDADWYIIVQGVAKGVADRLLDSEFDLPVGTVNRWRKQGRMGESFKRRKGV